MVVKNNVFRVLALISVVKKAIYRVLTLMPVVKIGIYRVLGVMPVVRFWFNLFIIRYLIKFKEQSDDFETNHCCVFGGG